MGAPALRSSFTTSTCATAAAGQGRQEEGEQRGERERERELGGMCDTLIKIIPLVKH